MVEQLQDYLWSSYPAYIGLVKSPPWLEREFTYQRLKHPKLFSDYRGYVMKGLDEQTKVFHEKDKMGSVFGDEVFKHWIYDELLLQLEAEEKSRVLRPHISMNDVIDMVAAFYQQSLTTLTTRKRGLQPENEPRKVAIYLCQELAAARLVDIALFFNMIHCCSVTHATHQIRVRKRKDIHFATRLDAVIKTLVK